MTKFVCPHCVPHPPEKMCVPNASRSVRRNVRSHTASPIRLTKGLSPMLAVVPDENCIPTSNIMCAPPPAGRCPTPPLCPTKFAFPHYIPHPPVEPCVPNASCCARRNVCSHTASPTRLTKCVCPMPGVMPFCQDLDDMLMYPMSGWQDLGTSTIMLTTR